MLSMRVHPYNNVRDEGTGIGIAIFFGYIHHMGVCGEGDRAAKEH